MSNTAFTVSKIGDFPKESYEFAPITSIIPINEELPCDILNFYCRQPHLWLYKLEGNSYVTTTNATLDRNNWTIEYQNNGKITFNALAARNSIDFGYIVNFFKLEKNTELDEELRSMQYGYLFYPEQLVLTPVSVSKTNNNRYSITLEAGILQLSSIFFRNSTPERRDSCPFFHDNYIKTDRKNIIPYPTSINNSCNFLYSISSTKSVVGKELIPYSSLNQPSILFTTLENNNYFKRLRKDTTFFEFSLNYRDEQVIGSEKEKLKFFQNYHPDAYERSPSLSIPINFINQTANDQTFLLLQSSVNINLPIQSTQNCVLSSNLNLNSTRLEYRCKTASGNTIIKGNDNTSLKISYIVDSANMIQGDQAVQQTIYDQQSIINGTLTPLNSAIPSTRNNHNRITYITTLPPHYYSYHISLNSPPQITSPIDRYSLSFTLTSVAYRETTNSVLISTYIRDEFGKINLDLETYGVFDQIMYKPDFLFDASILNEITVKVGTDTVRNTYDLKNPQWLPAQTNTVLEISFLSSREGFTDLSIRPILKNDHIGESAAPRVSIIPIKGTYKSEDYQLEIKTIKEGNDYIDLSIENLNDPIKFPFTDLTDSNIEWKLNNPDPNVKINYLIKQSNNTYRPINFILPNTTLPYNSNSWAVRLSGYGPDITTITLSSQKYNSIVSVSTDSSYFDFYTDKKLLIAPTVSLNDQNEIRTITLSAYVPFQNRNYNINGNNVIYWTWTYNNIYNETIPITAKYVKNNNYYQAYDNDLANNLDTLQFLIKPQKNIFPNPNIIKINVFTSDTLEQYTGTYTLTLNDFPNDSIFNADFDITYPSYPNDKLLETRKGTNILTRLKNGNAIYRLTANTDAIPRNSTLTWTITDSDNITTTFTGNTYTHDARNKSKYLVNLKVSNAIVNGWEDTPHSTERNCVIYSLDSSIFDKELKFISYPEYAWRNSDQATILTPSNFNTIAAGTTAYDYKKSNTEVFYVSANGNFDRYVYRQGSNRRLLLDTTNDGVNKLTLNYSNEFRSSVGTKLYLSAFNEYFPSNTPLYYKTIEGSSLVTKSYNIVAESIPYRVSTPSNLLFFQNPKLMDYNGITHTFSATITSFDLDVNRSVLIRQRFQTNPLNTPAKIQSDSSTVTYILSAPKWIVKREIPAVDGVFNVFTIRPGDDLSPLRVKNTTLNTLYLNASSNLNIKIPQSTFDDINVGNLGLRQGGDFWNTKNISITQRSNWQTLQAYTTSTTPEIFLNTNYLLSGNQVFVEFNTPEYTNNPIIKYAVNFGEGNIQEKNKDQTFYNTYTTVGTFYITYSAIYANNSKKVFTEKTPFIVKKNWDEYNRETIRVINEAILQLPYSLNDISIQPNEFGDSDIFNTSLKRIDDNLNYLKNNIQTINNNAPSYYYGWMGSNRDNRSDGIRWYTQSYGSEFYDNPSYTSSEGTSYFTDIKDIHVGNYVYILDDKKFRLFKKDKRCQEVIFSNTSDMEELFFDPKSITLNDDETSIYVADSIRNKIFRFDFDFADNNNPIFSLVLTVGTLGALNDKNKFDFPSEIFYWNENVFVLDYNNNCVKQYSGSLSWIHTYYDDILSEDQMLNLTVHESGLLYIVTKNLKVHIFDEFAQTVYSTFEINEIGTSEIVKITFDENGEFLYVVTKGNIFKYSSVGEFITTFNLPNINGLNFTSSKHFTNRELYVSTKTSILKFQDFVQLFKIGDGLDSKYWTLDQILLKKEEFATDINYNLALNRTAQNLKTFRNSLNAKFVLVTEQTARGSATYFTLVPILKEDNVKFEDDIENEKLKIGVNEFYVPSVANRELKKLYDSQIKLRENLDVSFSDSSTSNLDGEKSKCGGDFCWSWKAMSCYDLSLPLIRLCNINPITYAELINTFPVNYAPTKQWKDASSNCCNEYTSPLI